MKKLLLLLALIGPVVPLAGQQYKNFKVSIYCRAFETEKMGDENFIKPVWDEISRQLKVDKVYLETHRDLTIVDQQTLDKAKKFFRDRGIEVAGGITYTVSEPNRFETFCYTNPEHRKKVREIAEYTARNFDEVILDDFFFTNCKCELCVKAKGEKSWTDYRLELMTKAAQELVIGPAKAVNPKVKVIIKYPNWYDHFAGLGFDLKNGPKIFDGIYTGTETRDARSNQHLQPYLGYNIIRYFENLKPGGNGGGWVDPGGAILLDRYAEQLWITIFAKAREITLFDIFQLNRIRISDTHRAPWQGQQTSFDFDEMMKPVNYNGGTPAPPTGFARAAGYTFEKVDRFLGQLGQPVGIKSYRPAYATGEDFLQNYLGMIGLPIDMVPGFPTDEKVILLTEQAAVDPGIVEKIKGQLAAGKKVVITSGLLKKLQNNGIEQIAEIRYSDRKALVSDFGRDGKSAKPILIPQILYLTNDSWEQVSALDGPNGWPILHEADYMKGKLEVLTIPENFADLYQLPAPALNRIREMLSNTLNVQLEGPGQISLYVYDNNTFIVESFLPETTEAAIVLPVNYKSITDLENGENLAATLRETRTNSKQVVKIQLKPHSFRVFKINE